MSYCIEKQFEVATSHRIFNQTLDFSMCSPDVTECKCQHQHGHTGVYLVRLSADKLIKDMVVDFNEIGFFKKALDKYIDHHHMIYENDPQFRYLVEDLYKLVTGHQSVPYKIIPELSAGKFIVKVVDVSEIEEENVYRTLLESYVIINFNSSSENIAEWTYNVIKNKIDQFIENHPEYKETGLRVHSASYKESPKSMATYSE